MRPKKQRFYQFVIVSAAFSLLVFPTVVWFSAYSKFDCSVLKDIQQFKDYYQDNFPFRKQMIRIYYGITSKLCFQSTSHIPGTKSNWFFLERTYRGFLGKNEFSSDKKKVVVHKLEAIDRFLKKRNIKLIVMITPDKIQIYPEFLPWIMRRKQAKINSCEDLVKYINQHSDILICYPKKELIQHKTAGLLYYPNDSHWTMKGAYIAFYHIAGFMDGKISWPHPQKLPWIEKEVSFGDLKLVFPYKVHFPAGIAHTTTYDVQHTFDLEKRDRRFITPEAPSKLKIMVFHDSFFISMEPYFHHFFCETHQVARTIDYGLIEKERPNIVFFQVVERNADSLLTLTDPPQEPMDANELRQPVLKD